MKNQTSGLLAKLLEVARARKLFQRERVPLEVRMQAILLYHRGLSYRKIVEHFESNFSAQSVKNWVDRFSIVFNYPRGRHEIIIVDETVLHRGRSNVGTSVKRRSRGPGKGHKLVKTVKRAPPTHVLWVAINAITLEVVCLKLARVQNNNDCYEFLAETRLRSNTNPLIIHDRGPWYKSQPDLLGLNHQEMRGGIRSRIENWNRQLKHRLDGFWRAWSPNTSEASMEMWLKTYSAMWNIRRAPAP